MTFKRYLALKKSWQQLPPLSITTLAIAKCLGLEMQAAPDPVQPAAKEKINTNVFYDESYYENTPATPWQRSAADNLSGDFQTAGGMVK